MLQGNDVGKTSEEEGDQENIFESTFTNPDEESMEQDAERLRRLEEDLGLPYKEEVNEHSDIPPKEFLKEMTGLFADDHPSPAQERKK